MLLIRLAALSMLPPVIRHYDDFDETQHSIRDPAGQQCFALGGLATTLMPGNYHVSGICPILVK